MTQEELEKAAEQDVCEVVNCYSATGIPNDHIPSWVQDAMINEFIHGANWQKEKDEEEKVLIYKHGWDDCKEHIMKNAFDAEVLENYDGKVIKYDETILDKKLSNCEVFDKVKVIIIKEN